MSHVSKYQQYRVAELHDWVFGLLQPESPQSALLLTGPECAGKTTFHQAMGLLLPDRAIIRFPEEAVRSKGAPHAVEMARWNRRLEEGWLMVVEGRPERYVNLVRHPQRQNGRYLKWLLTHTQSVEMSHVQHFRLGLLATTVPQMLSRLEEEKDSFIHSLSRCRAAA